MGLSNHKHSCEPVSFGAGSLHDMHEQTALRKVNDQNSRRVQPGQSQGFAGMMSNANTNEQILNQRLQTH